MTSRSFAVTFPWFVMRSNDKPEQVPSAVPAAASLEQARANYKPLNQAMERYADGDEASFRTLHAGLSPRLFSFLLRMTGNAVQAADLLQEAFLRIHRARASFAPGAAVVPWALAIARNVYLDLMRKNRGLSPAELSAETEAEDRQGSAEDRLLAEEAAEVMKRALAALPTASREAYILLRYEGLSLAEAAEVLETTETAVKLRKFRAQEALRAALADWRSR